MPRVTMPKDHPYTGGVTLPDGQEVTPGKSVDVTEALAAALADQGWSSKEPTADEIVGSVGSDPVAAQAALDIEEASDKPRAGLVKKLAAVIAANPPDQGDPTAADAVDTKEP